MNEKRSQFRYAGWPAAAVDLVEHAIRTHGGWDRWKALEVLNIWPASLAGPLPSLKGLGRTFGLPRRFELRPHRGVAIFHGYPDEDSTGLYEQGTVSLIDAKTTETLIGAENIRASFRGRSWTRRFSALDALYFFGYALLHYHSIPFTLGEASFVGLSKVRSGGRALTALSLEFPPEQVTHCARQTIFFGSDGLVSRHDYTAEIISSFARGCHLWRDYELVDGFMLATKRRVVVRAFGKPLPLPILDASFRQIEVEMRA